MFAPAPAAAGAAAAAERPAASAPAAASGAKANANASEKAAPPLDLSIKRFVLNDGTVNVHDAAASRPVDVGLQKLAVTLNDFSTLASAPAHYTLNTDFKDGGGSLGADGQVGLAAKTASAKLDLKSLKLPLLQPYLDTATAAQVTDGALSATTNVDANWCEVAGGGDGRRYATGPAIAEARRARRASSRWFRSRKAAWWSSRWTWPRARRISPASTRPASRSTRSA